MELALLAAIMIMPLHALALTILSSTISVPVGVNPTSMAYDPLNGYIYVSNTGTTVTVINIPRVIEDGRGLPHG